jgi:multidrug efflux system outer membrane protein
MAKAYNTGQRIRMALVLMGAGFMSACSWAPRYERPALPTPDQWPRSAQADGQVPQARSPGALGWRSYFQEPRLQRLIEAALVHNRDLVAGAATVEEARAQAGYSQAQRLPALGINASRTNTWTPAGLTSSPSRESLRYDANVGLSSFEIDFWLSMKNSADAAEAAYLASAAAQRSLQLSVIGEVAQAWYRLVEKTQRVRLARATMTTREDSERLARRRQEMGLLSQLDYLNVASLTQAARADWASLERDRAAAENALQLLTGLPVSSEDLGHEDLDALAAHPLSALSVGLPSEVLLSRPDVMAAEYNLIAANANIGVARAAFLPKILLTGSFGTASPALSGLFDTGSRAWSYTPTFNIPILGPLFSARPLIDMAQARKVAAVARYEQVVQQAFREVADLLSARAQWAEQLDALQRYAQQQTQRLALTRRREAEGLVSRLELLDAQRDAYAAQQNLLQAQSAQRANAALLYKALGGTLEAVPEDSPSGASGAPG